MGEIVNLIQNYLGFYEFSRFLKEGSEFGVEVCRFGYQFSILDYFVFIGI